MNDPGNQVPGFLGDLLKLLSGSQGANAWLEGARALAQSVATDGAPEANADPLRRIELEELARVAELHVADITGIGPGPGTGSVRFSAVGRGTWALRQIDSWRPFMERMVAAQQAVAPHPDANPDLDDASDLMASGLGGSAGAAGIEGAGGIEDFLGQVASTMGPVLLGMQFGSAAGHLAQQALGHYALPLPRPDTNELFVITDNVVAFAEDWSLPLDQTQLWVCARELAAHAVLSRPHVAERIAALVDGLAAESAAAQQGLAERLGGDVDPEFLQHLMADPESLLADLLTPGQRRTSDQLVAVTTALGGYVDHVTARVATALFGSPGALGEAWYRRRTADAAGVQAAAALFGLDLGREQVDRGAAFVDGVVDRAGEDGLARLWESAATLPTPAELDAPGLWLERINLPELEPGDDGDR